MRDSPRPWPCSRINPLDTSTKKAIRDLQAVLQSIQDKRPAPFNVTFFTTKGLVTSHDHYKLNAYGLRVRVKTTYHLTDKAKQFLNVLVWKCLNQKRSPDLSPRPFYFLPLPVYCPMLFCFWNRHSYRLLSLSLGRNDTSKPHDGQRRHHKIEVIFAFVSFFYAPPYTRPMLRILWIDLDHVAWFFS